MTLQEVIHDKSAYLKAHDKSDKYKGMIHAFECDFNLIEANWDVNHKKLFEEQNKTFLKDIELLRELSFKLRLGKVKIVERSTRRK